MSKNVMLHKEDITVEWLTEVMRGRGYLTRGRIEHVHYGKCFETLTSLIVYLEVVYSNDAEASGSTHLLMKMAMSTITPDLIIDTRKEVEFYRTVIAQGAYNLPVPRCYDAAFDEMGHFHILMDDATQTHMVLDTWPVPPTIDNCQLVIDSLARFHARWWGCTQFGEDILPPWQGEAAIQQCIEEWQQSLRQFADSMGDNLSARRLSYFEAIVEKLPALLVKRYQGLKDLTLVHGDAHFWNYMYPRDQDRDQVLIIDWQSAGIATAASDLAYMITVHWYPERRAYLEQPLLQRYHQQLIKHGIHHYTWDNFWYDYRLEYVYLMLNAIWQYSVQLPTVLWWNHLERNVMAFEDLHCMELLQ